MSEHLCRSCGAKLEHPFCDLGTQPLANGLLSEAQLEAPETHWPLRPLVCAQCLLVQLPDTPPAGEIFTDEYPFYAGQSGAWVEHCDDLALDAIGRFGLGPGARVLELGSNDGTMLRAFTAAEPGIHTLGVEPCRGVAQHALRHGIPTDLAFFSECYARELSAGGYQADLLIATNVLAHVPDLGDFLRGVRTVLADRGVAILEVPDVGCLIAEAQFDQIYAEHHCYFSLHSLEVAVSAAGLRVADVEHLGTHGGSLRVFVLREDSTRVLKGLVGDALRAEVRDGLTDLKTYTDFAARPPGVKIDFLRRLSAHYGSTWGYGASAKAITLLNYCGVGPELIAAVADTTPAKQGRYMPGCRIPIVAPEALAERAPMYVVNFLWNWREESERNIHELCPDAEILYPNTAAAMTVLH